MIDDSQTNPIATRI